MTDLELRAARALSRVTFLPATPAKRFAREMAHAARVAPSTTLTPKQREYLWGLVWRHRRQIEDADLVATADSVLEREQFETPVYMEVRVPRQLSLFRNHIPDASPRRPYQR